jgi:hypothetical protein
MSLNVAPELLAAAERDEVEEVAFVDCVRTSLPYAWRTVEDVATRLREHGGEFADNQLPPPDEQARGELLRALASDAIRGSLERHFEIKLAFQNCHRVAAFAADAGEGETHREFTSVRAQLLNQTPELRNC